VGGFCACEIVVKVKAGARSVAMRVRRALRSPFVGGERYNMTVPKQFDEPHLMLHG
jgi:hypothetical protein